MHCVLKYLCYTYIYRRVDECECDEYSVHHRCKRYRNHNSGQRMIVKENRHTWYILIKRERKGTNDEFIGDNVNRNLFRGKVFDPTSLAFHCVCFDHTRTRWMDVVGVAMLQLIRTANHKWPNKRMQFGWCKWLKLLLASSFACDIFLKCFDIYLYQNIICSGFKCGSNTFIHTHIFTTRALANLFINNLAFWRENVQNVCHSTRFDCRWNNSVIKVVHLILHVFECA